MKWLSEKPAANAIRKQQIYLQEKRKGTTFMVIASNQIN